MESKVEYTRHRCLLCFVFICIIVVHRITCAHGGRWRSLIEGCRALAEAEFASDSCSAKRDARGWLSAMAELAAQSALFAGIVVAGLWWVLTRQQRKRLRLEVAADRTTDAAIDAALKV